MRILFLGGDGYLGYEAGSLPATESLAERILSLPLYPELPEEAVERVCAALGEAVATSSP